MRLSSSTTRRCGASSLSGLVSVLLMRPTRGSAFDQAIDHGALRFVDDHAQEGFGAVALGWRQVGEGGADAALLRMEEAQREGAACGGRIEQALAAVDRAGQLLDEAAIDELLEDAAETLLGELEDIEEIGDADAGMPVEEVDDAMMGAAEAVAEKRRVGVGGEVAIGEEEEFDEGDLRAIGGGERHADRPYNGCLGV